MAMLAGPRRKQKVINLRAKNNAWSNDANKFGQRMLEKMGWSSGKGLGAKEDGIVEHVVARYKNDEKGLGFEDKNDQWTKHEDDFNALLSNLSNASGDDKKLHSGVSLEDKSKRSKARVHYHKFTRGKDLTRYSEKDLANIFGKKSLTDEEKPDENLQADVEKESALNFSEKGSMEDYFKNKMSAFKSKSKVLNMQQNTQSDDVDYVFKGFSAQSDVNESVDAVYKDDISFNFNSNSTNEGIKENGPSNILEFVTCSMEDEKDTKKTKKKKSKCKNYDLSSPSLVEQEKQSIDEELWQLIEQSNDSDVEIKSNKSKKKPKQDEFKKDSDEEIKSKKKKLKSKETIKLCLEPHVENQEDFIPKKKKKRKNKDLE